MKKELIETYERPQYIAKKALMAGRWLCLANATAIIIGDMITDKMLAIAFFANITLTIAMAIIEKRIDKKGGKKQKWDSGQN